MTDPNFIPDSDVIDDSVSGFIPDRMVMDDNQPVNTNKSLLGQVLAGSVSPNEGALETLGGGIQTGINGMMLGYGDRAMAGVNALLDFINRPLGEAYNDRLAQAKLLRNQFKDTANDASNAPLGTAIEVGAGFLQPGMVYKALKAAPLKASALIGGIAGSSGEGDAYDRLKGAALGAAVGTGLTGGTQLAGALGKKLLTSDKVLNAIDYLVPPGTNMETGALGEGRAVAAPLTPEQIALAERTRAINPNKLLKAQEYLANAQLENSPVSLTEAINDPSITRQARALANHEATMSEIGSFVENRSNTTPKRIEDIANQIAPAKSAYEGGQSLQKGANAVDQAFRAARREVANPLFESAFSSKPILKSKDTLRLLEHPDIKPSVEDARKVLAIRNGTTPDKIPTNSTEVANEVLAELSSKARSAKYSAGDKASFNLTEAQAALEKSVYKEAPKLGEARAIYAKISEAMKERTGQGGVKVLKDLESGSLESAGEKLLNMPGTQLKVIRKAFSDSGQSKNLKDGVRAYIQQIVDKNSGEFTNQKDLVANILGGQKAARIRAVLGDKESRNIINSLARERRIFKGTQGLGGGSTTAGNLAEADLLKVQPSTISKLAKAIIHPKTTIENIVNRFAETPVNEKLARGLARTYITDPRKGLQDLSAILPIQSRRFPYVNNTNNLMDALMSNQQVAIPGLSGSLPKGEE